MSEFTIFQTEMKEMFEYLKSSQEALFNKKVLDVNEIKSQNCQIQKSNLDIEKSLESIKLNYECVILKIEKLENERQQYFSYIEKLEMRIECLEFGSRSSSMELRNLPPKEKESAE